MRQRRGERGDLADALVVVVDAGDHRDAEADGVATLGKRPQVGQDRTDRRAGDFAVPGVVHQLEVVQEEVNVGPHLIEYAPRGKPAGVQRGVDLPRLARIQERQA